LPNKKGDRLLGANYNLLKRGWRKAVVVYQKMVIAGANGEVGSEGGVPAERGCVEVRESIRTCCRYFRGLNYFCSSDVAIHGPL